MLIYLPFYNPFVSTDDEHNLRHLTIKMIFDSCRRYFLYRRYWLRVTNPSSERISLSRISVSKIKHTEPRVSLFNSLHMITVTLISYNRRKKLISEMQSTFKYLLVLSSCIHCIPRLTWDDKTRSNFT